MVGFRITWECVSDESAEHGDAESRGFLDGYGLPFDYPPEPGQPAEAPGEWPLREALAVLDSALPSTANLEAVEASDSVQRQARWITWSTGRDYHDGKARSLSLHIPEHVTPASRGRLCRLLATF